MDRDRTPISSNPPPFEGTARFRLTRRIGEGGMGVVYEALDLERNSLVALKTLRWVDPGAILRLKHEFRALRDLQHPNLLTFGELIEERGQWFFTMELLRGVDWIQFVQSDAPAQGGSPFDERRLRDGLRQLALGLQALHDAHKVHRDIKPSNILVTAEGRVVILDFGLVSDLVRDQYRALDQAAGTLAFMAPEQASSTPVGPEADWYAVGTLLYMALSGSPPFTGTRETIVKLKRSSVPAPPRTLQPNVPSDLEALCLELLRADPRQRPDGPAILRYLGAEPAGRPTAATRQTPFVGREPELAQLRRAFARTRLGRGATVLVHGESGVGKSALVDRFVEDVVREAPDAVVLSGRCYERESVPYKALDEVVDGLSRHLQKLPAIEATALLPRMASLLTQVFPVLRGVDAFAQAPPPVNDLLDARELRDRAFQALREVFCRLGDRHPLVVVIDDLQWADADSLALLVETARPPGAPTMLLVGTLRTGTEASNADPLLERWYAQMEEVEHVQLRNLPPADARRLVQLLAPAGPFDAEAVVEETGGHPLFIDALVRHRQISRGGGAVALDEALWARLQAMDPLERCVAELVAVAGHPLAQEVVAQAAGVDLQRLSEAAVRLRVVGFVRIDGVHVHDAIEPYHERVAAAVRARLPSQRLAAHHGRLAAALEATVGPDPEALAIHWQAAGELDKAARFALAAARRSARALAFDRAARFYRLALEVRPVEGAEGCELRTRYAEALAQAGRGFESAQAFRAASALAHGDEQADLRRRAGEQLLLAGHIDEGLDELGGVLDAAGLALAPTPARAVTSFLLRRAWLRVRGTRFRERQAAELPPQTLRRIDLSISVAEGLGWVDILRAAEFQTRLLLRVLKAGEPYRLACALAREAGVVATSGGSGPRRAAKLFALAEQLARKSGQPHALAVVLAWQGYAAVAEHQLARGRELNEQAEAILTEQCAGHSRDLALVRINLLFCLRLLGELREMAARGERYLRTAEERGDLFAATSLSCGTLWFVALADDDPARARSLVDGAMRRWSQEGFHLQHMYALSAHGFIDLYEGEPGRAYRRLADAWPQLVSAKFLRVRVTRWWLRAQRASAAIGLAGQKSGRDRERLLLEAEQHISLLDRERLPGLSALARAFRARIRLLREDAVGAASLYDQAAERWEAAGMLLFAASARRLQARMVGGDQGRRLLAASDEAMRARGVRAPGSMIAHLFFGERD